MTTVVANGNTYSDAGESAKDMRSGGHRTLLLPMLGDVMVEVSAAKAARDAAAASAATAAASAATASGFTGAFAPSAQATPNMTVLVSAGDVYDGSALLEKTAQSSATIVKPTTNPRIDRIVGDALTGVISVVAGTEAASPVAPAIPAGKFPICRVALTTSMSTITNAMITDERARDGGALQRSGGTITGALAVQPATLAAHPATAAQVQAQALTAFTTGGVSGTFTLTPVPALTSYAAGQRFRIKLSAAGSGTDTLNVSGLGAKSLKQYDSTGAKVAAVLASGQLADVEYDGVDFVVLDPLPAAATWSALSGKPTTLAGYGMSAATLAEASAGADDTKPLTPRALRDGLNASGSAPVYACRAWCNFNGTGAVAIRASGNVSSITDNGVGDYTINFTVALPDANFCFAGGGYKDTAAGGNGNVTIGRSFTAPAGTTSSLRITTQSGSSPVDSAYVDVSIFR